MHTGCLALLFEAPAFRCRWKVEVQCPDPDACIQGTIFWVHTAIHVTIYTQAPQVPVYMGPYTSKDFYLCLFSTEMYTAMPHYTAWSGRDLILLQQSTIPRFCPSLSLWLTSKRRYSKCISSFALYSHQCHVSSWVVLLSAGIGIIGGWYQVKIRYLKEK